jgi:hypothetical protein
VVVVLHSFSRFRFNEQLETWQALEEIRNSFPVVDAFLVDEQDYDKALEGVWGKGDLIVVEQDIVPTVEMIAGLFGCDKPWCIYEYEIRYMDDKNPPFYPQTGLGLTKFSCEAQQISAPERWGKGPWFNLDGRVTGALIQAGYRPHVHGKVKHNRIVDWTGKTK